MLFRSVTSEIRQSLYKTPDNDFYGAEAPSVIEHENSLWGFYADGFFDRMSLVSSPNGSDSTTVGFNSSNISSIDNARVAYAGMLFYNPETKASLFFPAAGTRSNTNGALENSGALGSYWTSTYNGNNGWAYSFTPSSFYIYSGARQSSGASVRCVKSYFGLPGSPALR